LRTTAGKISALLCLCVAAGFIGAPIVALAQTPASDPFGLTLHAPRKVVLYVHASLQDAGFVEALTCMLQNTLRAPVSTKSVNFPLGSDLLATPTQLSAEKLVPAFYRAAAATEPPGTFSFLLLPNDLKAAPFHYVFSMTDANYGVVVLSTARLDPGGFAPTAKARDNITALRAYKLLLKAVARLSGYGTEQGCILAFPRSLDELDAKSKEFCPDDRGVLVAAGVLKVQEDKGCNVIADFDRRLLMVRDTRRND
jgi:predicted Zn-dependent protease